MKGGARKNMHGRFAKIMNVEIILLIKEQSYTWEKSLKRVLYF